MLIIAEQLIDLMSFACIATVTVGLAFRAQRHVVRTLLCVQESAAILIRLGDAFSPLVLNVLLLAAIKA